MIFRALVALLLLTTGAFAQNPGLVYQGASPAANDCVKFVNRSIVTTAGTACATVTFANPTASIGLSAVNGVATTAMRSDAAPALDQSIQPTWTNPHAWIKSGTTTTSSTINSLGAAGTGNITVGSTTGWPSPGVLKVRTGAPYEYMAYTVVDATTLNITARAMYGSTGVAAGNGSTLAYAIILVSASTSSFPKLSIWSDGVMGLGIASSTSSNVGIYGFEGANASTGLYAASSVVAASVNTVQQTTLVGTGGAPGIGVPTAGVVTWNNDLILTRAAAAVLQLGAASALSPIAQAIQAQGSRPGTDSNVGGANLTISSGNGTGTGTLSSLVLQSPVAAASGTGTQTQTTGWRITNGVALSTGYTVAALPTCAAGIKGGRAHVTDALTPAFLATVVGGGAITTPVFCDGTNWVGG